MKHPIRVFSLAVVLVCAAAQAQAIGRLADLTVVDRSTGVTLPVYFHRGEYWVAGQPGARYAISIRNQGGERLLAVTSVDGINVLNGASAGYNQTGYVFGAYNAYEITGWRKSEEEVAAFEFAAASNSYAARTGRASQIGVIGVALFRERAPEPTPAPISLDRSNLGSANDAGPAGEARPAASPAPAAKSAGAAGEMSQRNSSADRAASAQTPQLGTGHGQRESSYVSHTNFERAQSQPNEVIRIRYDSREALVAMGVLPDVTRRTPNPFPLSDSASYVPDPPTRRF